MKKATPNNEFRTLWSPTEEQIEHHQLSQFQRKLEAKHGQKFDNYAEFQQWSVDNIAEFWAAIWEYCGILHSHAPTSVVDHLEKFPGAQWFPNAKLNFAENLLRHTLTETAQKKTALICVLDNGQRQTYSYQQLRYEVAQLANAMRQQGVGIGDRVAGFMPNIAHTVFAMLATTSLGAIWTSCSPDFGVNGACDRFGQIEPTLLFTTEAYSYNGKQLNSLEKVKEIQARLKSFSSNAAAIPVVVVPLLSESPNIDRLENATIYNDFIDHAANDLDFAQLPFDHPIYINYSSGTTGAPKCIVHGAGGSLLQHLKEHQLHCNLRAEDVLFYFTTCGWMMWNWLVSGLACGSTLVLFDGSPFAQEGNVLLDLIDAEQISLFGTSAKYISALETQGHKPAQSHNLSSVHTILSTGSPLSGNSYDFIYRDFKSDVCLSSISGGTDILSCFVLGNANLPVVRGEIQCIGLGMAVEVWNDEGEPVRCEKGELVCTKPFPSTPIGFWNDKDGRKFRSAYFNNYPNVWAHGDYAEITKNQGVIIHGRSDAILNPGGVRIGTAEIYRQVEKITVITESIVVGQDFDDDVRVVLFVVLREGTMLDKALVQHIKTTIRNNATPRHVPAKIIQVADIPRTISGKIVEVAVKQIIHGRTPKNIDALANPEALDLYRDLEELMT